jgi:hypothetical protein
LIEPLTLERVAAAALFSSDRKQYSEDRLSCKVCDILGTGPTEEDHRHQRTPTEMFSIVDDIYAIGIAVQSASIVNIRQSDKIDPSNFDWYLDHS